MKVTAQLLQKYAAGEYTPEERLLVEDWVPGDEDIRFPVSNKKLD